MTVDPATKSEWMELRNRLVDLKKNDTDWIHGKVSAYNYKMTEELDDIIRDAYQLYFGENALGSKVFPSVATLEQEVIDYGLTLFGCPDGGAGIFTSGGTESVLLCVKGAREWARRTRPEVENPTVVAPETAHPSFNKAAYLLGLTVHRVPMRSDFRADVAAMEAAITPDTIMLVGSAPAYPHGTFDDIEGIGRIALDRGIWCHVDACLGGFLSPFVKALGYPIPPFDFRVPGVVSLSADLHKHGYAPKGASLALFRNDVFKDGVRFEFRDWPRGRYVTYTLSGSRAAGPIAGAWAALNFLGEAGYVDAARIIMETKEQLITGVEAIPGLRVHRPTDLSIFIYDSVDAAVEINAVMDGMRSRGWFVGSTAEPVAVHYAVNPIHAQSVDAYLADLAAVVEDVRSNRKVAAFNDHTY